MNKVKIKKYHKNPILTPDVSANSFEKACVYNPAAIVRDNKVFLLYRAEEGYYDNYISRVGLATSEDGFEFERYSKNPVIDVDEDKKEEKRGCEDLRVIRADEKYFLTYTAYAGAIDGVAQITLSGAFSDDLIHWEKIGALIPGQEKAGLIVQGYKYNGEYVMYFGEGHLKIAFSNDLKNWRVMDKPVLEPREGYFDDFLVEGGPPPIVTDEGIFMVYNSAKGEMGYRGKREYISYYPAVAIFDKNDPTKVIYRSDEPVMEPTEYWERYGKVNHVIFANGLVNFNEKWLLYYGGADKSIGVAEITF